MSVEHSIHRVMSGDARGVGPTVLRGVLAAAEPAYRGVVGWRNRRFDRDHARARRLPRPVVSIGNLTTGGTGKTPVVRWMAGELRRRGLGVAVLSRGYKARAGTLGDEQRMLVAMLGGGGGADDGSGAGGPPVVIEADPDRFAAGRRVLARSPAIDVFVLDDGFQHRRLHRDLDVVLLHGGEPFGYGHALPRGLLREPTSSLARAGVVVVTSAGRADADRRRAIATEVRRWNAGCPVVFERHEPVGLRSPTVPSGRPVDQALNDLGGRRAFCFSGLGSPEGFEAQVRSAAGRYVGQRRFPDHHDYAPADVRALRAQASRAGADVLVTTEKDWAKLADIPDAVVGEPPVWRLDVEARFEEDGATVLLRSVERIVAGLPVVGRDHPAT